MEDNKSLFQLRRFKLAVIFIVTAFLGAVIYVSCTSSLVYVRGYEGLNKAVEIFRVPLGVLALIVPVVAVIAASHRSEQTKRQIDYANQQIDEMKKQNIFNAYFKHVEEFEKHVDALQSSHKIYPITDRKQLYKNLFPNNSPSKFTPITHPRILEGELWLEYHKGLLDSLAESSASEINAERLIMDLLWFSKSFYFMPAEGTIVGEYASDLGDVTACRLVIGREGPCAHLRLATSFLAQLASFGQLDMADTPAVNAESSFFSAEMKRELEGYGVIVDNLGMMHPDDFRIMAAEKSGRW